MSHLVDHQGSKLYGVCSLVKHQVHFVLNALCSLLLRSLKVRCITLYLAYRSFKGLSACVHYDSRTPFCGCCIFCGLLKQGSLAFRQALQLTRYNIENHFSVLVGNQYKSVRRRLCLRSQGRLLRRSKSCLQRRVKLCYLLEKHYFRQLLFVLCLLLVGYTRKHRIHATSVTLGNLAVGCPCRPHVIKSNLSFVKGQSPVQKLLLIV